jgi:hypothetical protein
MKINGKRLTMNLYCAVTEETWEWETVDASEEAPNKPVTPKSTATKTTSTSNKKSIAQPKKKNQASILNFFGKKP